MTVAGFSETRNNASAGDENRMITVTELAKSKIVELMTTEEPGRAVRVAIRGRGPGGFVYDLRFISEAQKEPADMVVDAGPFRLFVDSESTQQLAGATLDFVETPHGGGFKLDNPNPLWTDPLAVEVQRVIDERVNPGVSGHGGFVTLLNVKGDIAYIAFGGGCHGCGMVDVTLKEGIEVMIKEGVPAIHHVVDTTDHTIGADPYYKA